MDVVGTFHLSYFGFSSLRDDCYCSVIVLIRARIHGAEGYTVSCNGQTQELANNLKSVVTLKIAYLLLLFVYLVF